jgi:ribonuclease BN (tRNA processing enzyme)
MSALTVTFVGTGDAFGSGGRFQTCFLIDGPSQRFTIDFGATSLVALRQLDIDPNSIDTVLLTHLHGDHCGGVPFLLLDAMLGSRRTTPLTILGPTGTREHLKRVQDSLFPGSHTMQPGFELRYLEIEPTQDLELDGMTLSATRARHAREANPLALRVQLGNKRIAYTGDGEFTESLARFVNGVDLLIAESYFYDKSVRGHLNYPDIARLDASRIVLTHMHSNMLQQVDNIEDECAYDGYVITI